MITKVVTLRDLADGQKALADGQHELKAAIVGISRGQDGLITQLDNLTQKFDDFKIYAEAGFDTMNGRFDRLEDRIDCLSEGMDRVEAMLDDSDYRH